MMDPEMLLRELLAVVLRDGGQRVDEVGPKQATLEAIDEIVKLRRAASNRPEVVLYDGDAGW